MKTAKTLARWCARIAASVVVLAVLFVPRVPPSTTTQAPVAPIQPAAIPRGDARFLVVGLTQDRLRTDTIEVIHWDDVHHRVRILGVPRDINVALPGISNTKLVHAYSTGGIGRARAATVRLLNVPIAHYVVFSLPAMRHIVDLIGGVPITVEKRMVYTDKLQGLFINLSPGYQVLDGAHAEQYLRFRNDPEGDIGRIRRQQVFLRAAVAQTHRPSVMLRMPQIIQTARGDVETDLTASQLLGWLQRVQPIKPEQISTESIDGRPAVLYDTLARQRLDFWVPNRDDLRAKVRWLLTGVLPDPKP
ncbi:MAG TPA: LCP family protein [bacterium]|nr:LCP family protein [bacterium]